MKPNVEIVEASSRHHSFIAKSQVEMAFETERMQLDLHTVSLGVGAVLLDPSKGRYYIAQDSEGAPLACMLTLPEWSDWRNKTAIWIHSLYVLPEHRGKGVYRLMYEFLKNLVLNSDDLYALKLYVDKRNGRARQVYAKLGMSSDHYETYEWVREYSP